MVPPTMGINQFRKYICTWVNLIWTVSSTGALPGDSRCGKLTVPLSHQQCTTECPQDAIYVSMDKSDLNCGNNGNHGDPIDLGALDCWRRVFMLFPEFSFEQVATIFFYQTLVNGLMEILDFSFCL